ncbi:AAA ATPase-like protein [Entomoplasma freundtii]|uniref:Endonuclease GajA/Old nuclease/RecF-like AAA domain-containing protein n=1 Tax=Entomoplasma freundtii TaxID=74700 RepID=A0A2K8NS69_9MOLU|nr:AAA family ATPase [Entomoplasma freundtii]ATZ16617.1 hypothetical protein EFREU_v1c05970 [Entomoplasma freundtii]TDY58216.1 AAA ATPase-like protein [Entomoplasma freundtii]
MQHLNIKNYRNFENANFCISPLTILTGENNTGKTSLLKLMESVNNNKTLNFQGTSFNEVKSKDIIRNSKQPLEILLSYTSKEMVSRRLKDVYLMEKYDVLIIKDYDFPLIKKFYTWDSSTNELIIFEFEYDFSSLHQTINPSPKLKSIDIELFDLPIDKNLFLKKESYDFIGLINNKVKEYKNKWKSEKIVLSNYLNAKNHNEFHEIHTDFYKSQIFNILDRINTSLSLEELYALFIFCKGKEDEKVELPNKKEIPKNNRSLHKISEANIRAFEAATKGSRLRKAYNYFQYIGPIRPTFEEFYVQENFNRSKQESVNFTHFEAIKTFFDNKNILKGEMDKFFQSISNIQSIDIVEDIRNNNPHVYYYPIYKTKLNSTKEKKLKYSGTGVSQLFPILVNILTNKQKLNPNNIDVIKSIAIEQPELHLHPKAQNRLGSFFIDYIQDMKKLEKEIGKKEASGINLAKFRKTKQNLENTYLVIETHSTFIIDSMRKSINKIYKNKDTNDFNESSINNEINILFLFNKTKSTNIDYFSINEKGRLDGNYKNYVDFYINDAFEMLGI